ncbi:MAG: ClbS/DfsB family four-helix bundle protein [Chloroflexota bacterium]
MIDSGTVGDWSVKDVLAHLTAWQQMTLKWYRLGLEGKTPVTPSTKHTWREIPALNQEIYEIHHQQPLDDVKIAFEMSHREILNVMETISSDNFFMPKVYKWTKSTTLGSYFTSATSSHYNWALKEIRRGLKWKHNQNKQIE